MGAFFIFKYKGQVDDFELIELGKKIREVTGGEVAHGEKAALHHREKVVRTVAEIENVPINIDVNSVTQPFFEGLLEMDRSLAVGGVWRRISCKPNFDWLGHGESFSNSSKIQD